MLRAESEVIFNNNTTLSSVIRYDLVNTFDTLDQGSDSILPKVRTNISEYLRLKNDLAIARMQANQFITLEKEFKRNNLQEILSKCLLVMVER